MRPSSRLLCCLAVLLLAGLALPARAQTYSPRQYYGPVRKHPKYNYSYRTYYYKPTPTYAGYRHHYAVYVPARPKYIYYYNPYKKQYWGRCPAHSAGKPVYSLLAPRDRRASVEDIPESAFPPPGKLPRIPEAEDDARLDLPPDDLPATASLPTER